MPGSPLQGLRICLAGPLRARLGQGDTQAEMLSHLLGQEGATVRRAGSDAGPGLLLARLLWHTPRCDVVHVIAAENRAFLACLSFAMLAGRIFRKQVVASYLGDQAQALMARREWLAWRLLRRLEGLAVASHKQGEVFQRYGLEPAILPELVRIERFPRRIRTTWPALILWTGALAPEADPAMAVRALAALRRTLPEARLLLVGAGPLSGSMKALALELGVAEAISVRPWLPFHRLRQAIHAASVLWHTATEGPLPQTLLWAAAGGTVVVGVEGESLAELLHDGVDGLLVAPGDHKALAAATAQVLRRPALANGLASNARLAVSRHTWPALRPGIFALYSLPAEEEATVTDEEAALHEAGWLAPELAQRTEFLWSTSTDDL